MEKQQCIAMLLAGGQGSRLGILTQKLAKPAVPFGGKYRIIDFTLSNCSNSGISTVGVLTQYQPLILNSYIGIGSHWSLDKKAGGVTVLPPYVKNNGGEWYKGTADAICQNIEFIDQHDPNYVLVLSGDHIYKMDYSLMLDYHIKKDADATIAVIEVPWEETNRFGIMNTREDNSIKEFQEKPKNPINNLASMGVYIFNWSKLKRYLDADRNDTHSDHDFGKNIIPKMLTAGEKMFAYSFDGYWKDVGTIESLWEANMDLLSDHPTLNLYDRDWKIYSVNPSQPPQYIAPHAKVKRSLISEGCQVYGELENSVLFPGVYIGKGSKVKDSVVMTGVRIDCSVKIFKAIIGEETRIENGSIIGGEGDSQEKITVLGENIQISKKARVHGGTIVDTENCHQWGFCIGKDK
ncbi:glucose-1-phosphate adenylyltransferase [Anaerovirgula multivorans]|uniref:Glucose-1-phosphate adenylyltransferase n=1 Tax=Anaerovirgula multivorans TaxID=312168 RepID=A0A239K544_9FIRM|nr:glucose-1-phosphate adenylyltransferase [Anaerovirgula multivorans]SNT13275.1 glucose-1-phosphate adenylyltransferase [Anaerovirgula multivorans]